MPPLSYADEVDRLHAFFEDWFADRNARDFAEFDDAMADDFYLVSTDGDLMRRDEIVGFVHGARGTGVVEIRIVDPVVRRDDRVLIGTYEEHQVKRGIPSSRLSTTVMSRHDDAPGGWLWHAVHETWIVPPGEAAT